MNQNSYFQMETRSSKKYCAICIVLFLYKNRFRKRKINSEKVLTCIKRCDNIIITKTELKFQKTKAGTAKPRQQPRNRHQSKRKVATL